MTREAVGEWKARDEKERDVGGELDDDENKRIYRRRRDTKTMNDR